MAIAAPTAGARILTSDLAAFYNLLKGVSGSGEGITLIYNAAGAVIFQPSSDPAASTQLIQVKNNAGTVKLAVRADGSLVFADASIQTTAAVTFAGGTLTSAIIGAKSANITAASTTDLSTATGNEAHITGTTTITAFGTVTAGTQMRLIFDGALKVTYNATSVILDGAADFYTQAGDHLDLVSEGSGNWKEVGRGFGTAAAKYVTANLGAPVTMTNANQYYAGPSITLTGGIWLISGAVNVNCPTNAGALVAKIYDGSNTAVSSAEQYMATASASGNYAVNLSPAVVSLTGSTTMTLSCQSPAAGQIMKITPPNALSLEGNTSTRLTAIRLF